MNIGPGKYFVWEFLESMKNANRFILYYLNILVMCWHKDKVQTRKLVTGQSFRVTE